MSEWPDPRSPHEHLLASVEEMKRQLRERAQAVAARERELEELRDRLQEELGQARRAGSRRGADAAELDARERRLEQREQELAQALGQAERREREAGAELALAQAERERLDERERDIRRVERELAGLRVELEEQRARLAGGAQEPPRAPAEEPAPDAEPELPPPTPLPQPPAAPDLEPAAAALTGATLDDTVETPG